ncbi:MAG: GNAT family N-acetyltransferase [Prevotella sp.]|nr:GNAT family N-acetyltransferase [Prevotella sp.]
MLTVERYSQQWQREWNDFVARAKNATFLFDRRYMDYHADRFSDHSLLFFRDDRLYAILPANERGKVLYTHQGLTYGGLVMGMEATTVHIIEVFELLNDYLRANGFERVVYKAIPWIYQLLPAEEPLYAMHRVCNNRLLERDVSSAFVVARPQKWKKDRRHGLRVASDAGVQVTFGHDYAAFWPILAENLRVNHGVKPVHTLDEILLLQGRFPQNILLMEARQDGDLVAGCVLYVTPQTVHTQYIAATPQGKKMGAVDAIVACLLHSFPQHLYIDFGKSTETHSDILNEQLIYQKEGFGARAVCYDTYEWTV